MTPEARVRFEGQQALGQSPNRASFFGKEELELRMKEKRTNGPPRTYQRTPFNDPGMEVTPCLPRSANACSQGFSTEAAMKAAIWQVQRNPSGRHRENAAPLHRPYTKPHLLKARLDHLSEIQDQETL